MNSPPLPRHLNTDCLPVLALAVALLLSGLWSPAVAFAQDQPAGVPFEIELTLNQLLGEQEAGRYRDILAPGKKISWDVYLPNNDSTEPPGVLVYVSPRNRGRIHGPWRELMDRHNLIYIGANDSGNRMPVNRRMVLAIMALRALGKNHPVNNHRISISGFSGGGRVASMLATQYPEVFTGAVYICGVNDWNKALEPRVGQIIKNRFVFLTGSKDFNLDETRNVYRRYLEAGALHSKLQIIPGMSHELPDTAGMAEALEFLYGKPDTGNADGEPDKGKDV